MELRVEVNPPDLCREEFKKWMCNHFRVKSVNDLPFDVRTYCDFMECFEAGWHGREQQILNRILSENKKEVKENEWVFANVNHQQNQYDAPYPRTLERHGTESITDVYCK